MWRYLEISLLDVSPEVMESIFLGSLESGLRVRYTPSLDELVFSVTGLGGLANGRPRTCQSGPSLSRD
jgi:hypothetical protein